MKGNGWKTLPFEAAVRSRGSGRAGLPQKEWEEGGRFPVIGQGAEDIEGWTNREDLLLTPTPAVVLYGGHTRRAKHVSQAFVPGPNVKILQPLPELESKFLYYFLTQLPIESKGYADHFPLVRKCEVPVPPLAEQKRIVGVLDEALASLATAQAHAEKNHQNARALFESHLQSVFTQPGKGWVTKPLADCLELITYGFTNPMPTAEKGPYMITAKNVVGGRIDYGSTRRTSREAFDALLTDKSRPRVGDVLLTKDGTLGRVAVVDQPHTCINQSVALLRPNARMNPQFMRCLLGSSDYQQRMVDDAGGATIKHIYITRVDKMPVSFPESLAEQQKVVAGLDSLSAETQRLATLYERKVAALAALKQSLLHQAFTGNL